MDINLYEVKTFFDPHQGFAGALIPVPSTIDTIVNNLNGHEMPLCEAVTWIQSATNGKVTVRDGWISLEILEGNGTLHMFRVIRFK